MILLFEFVSLQVFDLVSTLLFLGHGVPEGNPLMRLAISVSPVLGLAVPKAAAVLLAVYAWQSGRVRLLRRMNVLFTLCVVWNLASLVRL
jgi:hypothetical protein